MASEKFWQNEKKITTPNNERSKTDTLVSELLQKLKEQQGKKHAQNAQEKNLQKRRIVCGAHETLKFVQRGKTQLVFYAKNLDENNVRAASNFHLLQRICPTGGIPMIEALTRKELSRVMNKFPYVGVIGVMDISGFEKEAEEIVREWRQSDSFRKFHIDQSSLLP